MTFSINVSDTSQNNDTEQEETVNQPFVRDESDNKIFTDIQVKDISIVTDKHTVGIYDADTLVYQACSNTETKYITVKHKAEDVEEDLPNITTFKGTGKGIKPSSWLGLQNVDRELKGLPLWEVEDFEVTQGQQLKFKTEEQAIEQAKIMIFTKMKEVRQQFGIPNIKLILGEGDNFRHKLPLCRPYKGTRSSSLRPLILGKVRDWVLNEIDSELATSRWDGEMVEADDVCEYYGSEGYKSYYKTGIFSYVVIASDKDACGNPKLLVNPDTHSGADNPLRGQYKFPQAMLIEASDKSAGDLELVAKKSGADIKGYGFKFIMYQAFLGGDGADNYNALSHLGQKLSFGDQAAYKTLKPCQTASEALQATIDVYAELLPYGVQYTSHDGVEMDVDCLTYMNIYFKVAYMMRNSKDKTDLYKLCEMFNVDTSKVVGNNSMTPPVRTYVPSEGKAIGQLQVLEDLINKELKSYKSLKKGDLVDKIDTVKETLVKLSESFEGFYDYKQTEKKLK